MRRRSRSLLQENMTSVNLRQKLLLFLLILFSNYAGGKASGDREVFNELLVNLPNCKIPECPMFPASILKEWKIEVNTKCEPQGQFSTISPDLKLSLTSNASKLNCCYTEIQRPFKLVDDRFTVSECHNIKPGDNADVSSMEFLFVNCTDPSSKQSLPPQFFSNFPKTKTVQDKINFWKDSPEKPFSVMLIILDSISRTHAYRSMPKSMKFVIDKLNFVDFKGYHTYGEPTIENYIPFALGRASNDTEGWDRRFPNYAGKWDDMPFIWKNFSSANYVTMNIEDSPNWHTFNFNGRTGFTYKPLDYYSRPYMLAQEKFNGRRAKQWYHVQFADTSFNFESESCMEGLNMWEYVLNFTSKFAHEFNPAITPSFSINFFSWPFHNYLFGLRVVDDPLLELMTNFSKNPGILNNTFIFLFGDHGFRWSNYSETQEGLLERDLPMFMVRMPDRFKTKYAKYAANLKQNTERVTTHVDFFKTMAHIHELTLDEFGKSKPTLPNSEQPSGKRSYGFNRKYGISLLNEIPITRTCDDAKILPRFCSCNYPMRSKDFVYKNYKKYVVTEGFEKERG